MSDASEAGAGELDIDNCGPMREGEEYCLFHKPEKSEAEVREFYASLQEQAVVKTGEEGTEKLVFENLVDWRGYVFPAGEDKAIFKGATFGPGAYFWGAIFEGKANFEDATFEDEAYFGGATFAGGSLFRENIFERTCHFEGAEFNGELSFANTDFRQGVMMEEYWGEAEKFKYRLPQAEQEGCRVQRLSYEKEGEREAADATFVREMRARRRTRTHEKFGKYDPRRLLCALFNSIEKVLLDLTCKYGTSWKQLIVSSFLVILAFSGLYKITPPTVVALPIFGETPLGGAYNPARGARVEGYLETLYFSITTFSTVGYGDLHPTGLLRLVAGFQSLLGAFFVALFVVVFARKWMRG